MLETKQTFRSEKHNLFTKKVNKIALSASDNIIHWIDQIGTYVYATSKDLVCKKEEIKCTNVIKQYKHD